MRVQPGGSVRQTASGLLRAVNATARKITAGCVDRGEAELEKW